jgi:hypothetical protein
MRSIIAGAITELLWANYWCCLDEQPVQSTDVTCLFIDWRPSGTAYFVLSPSSWIQLNCRTYVDYSFVHFCYTEHFQVQDLAIFGRFSTVVRRNARQLFGNIILIAESSTQPPCGRTFSKISITEKSFQMEEEAWKHRFAKSVAQRIQAIYSE